MHRTGQARVVVSVLRWQMEICWAHCLMMGGRMVFGEVIGMIGAAGTPKNVELALADPVADPIKMHVDGFGPLLFHGVIGNAAGGAVVGL